MSILFHDRSGAVRHPHPLFERLQDQLLREAERRVAPGEGFAVFDAHGTPVCGRVGAGPSHVFEAPDLVALEVPR